MRTTLNIDENLMDAISRETGVTNKSEIVETALTEYLGKIKRENLKKSFGKIAIDLDVRRFRESDFNE